MLSVVDSLKNKYGDKITIVKINVDNSNKLVNSREY
ncbi:MAG: hypothetical protein ACP5PS_09505 [Bacteroidales bacterium]